MATPSEFEGEEPLPQQQPSDPTALLLMQALERLNSRMENGFRELDGRIRAQATPAAFDESEVRSVPVITVRAEGSPPVEQLGPPGTHPPRGQGMEDFVGGDRRGISSSFPFVSSSSSAAFLREENRSIPPEQPIHVSPPI
jgi:hypothetical protein